MAIENINSLHYLNSNHTFQIHCDNFCESYLNNVKNKINYLNCVSIKNNHGEAIKPWQYYKIETLINASRQNAILTDADGIWHEDPIISSDVITLLVLAHKISENLDEKCREPYLGGDTLKGVLCLKSCFFLNQDDLS